MVLGSAWAYIEFKASLTLYVCCIVLAVHQLNQNDNKLMYSYFYQWFW